jgi:hypothetical protein
MHRPLLSPVFFLVGRQRQLDRVGFENFKFHTAFRALNDFADFNTVEYKLRAALRARNRHVRHTFRLLKEPSTIPHRRIRESGGEFCLTRRRSLVRFFHMVASYVRPVWTFEQAGARPVLGAGLGAGLNVTAGTIETSVSLFAPIISRSLASFMTPDFLPTQCQLRHSTTERRICVVPGAGIDHFPPVLYSWRRLMTECDGGPVRIEWMMLADAAQVTNNKLYVLGGGWERLTVSSDFPVRQRCSLALAFSVPWAETNQRNAFAVRIVDEDGKEAHGAINGHFETGRPAGLQPGAEQRVQVAIDMTLNLEKEGVYVIEANLAEQDTGRLTFTVRKNR